MSYDDMIMSLVIRFKRNRIIFRGGEVIGGAMSTQQQQGQGRKVCHSDSRRLRWTPGTDARCNGL